MSPAERRLRCAVEEEEEEEERRTKDRNVKDERTRPTCTLGAPFSCFATQEAARRAAQPQSCRRRARATLYRENEGRGREERERRDGRKTRRKLNPSRRCLCRRGRVPGRHGRCLRSWWAVGWARAEGRCCGKEVEERRAAANYAILLLLLPRAGVTNTIDNMRVGRTTDWPRWCGHGWRVV